MRRYSPAVLLLCLMSLVTVVAGCSPPPKKRTFNNNMARANKSLESRARNFYSQIYPLGTGKAVAATAARGALTDCEKELRDVKSQFSGMRGPANSNMGSDLVAKYQEFLTAQQSILDNCFKPIVAIVENNGTYPDPASKWAAIEPLLRKADEIEKPAWDAVNRLQRAYAEEHKLSIKR
jgi:hypothetical protein